MSVLKLVRTVDNKMMIDPLTGLTITSRRAHVIPASTFLQAESSNNEYRDANIEILSGIRDSDAISDPELGEFFQKKVAEGIKPDSPEFEQLVGQVADAAMKGRLRALVRPDSKEEELSEEEKLRIELRRKVKEENALKAKDIATGRTRKDKTPRV